MDDSIRGLAAPLIALALAGCAEGSSHAPPITRTDSAGVQIVDVDLSAPAHTLDLTSAQPLQVGAVDGAPEYLFSRIARIVPISADLFAVADAESGMLRFFDGAGRFVRSTGGSGEGPGEFRSLSAAGVRGDTLWTWDSRLNRFTWFDADGNVLRTATLDPSLPFYGSPQALDDGSFVMSRAVSSSDLGPNPVSGIHRDTSALLVVGPDGMLRDTVTVAPGLEVVIEANDRMLRMGISPFGRSRVYATAGDIVHMSTQDAFRIESYDATGRLLRVLRSDVDLTISDSILAAVRERELASIERNVPEAQREAARTAFLEDYSELPPTRPAHGSILTDDADNLWVAEHAPRMAAPRVWNVFDAHGNHIRRVLLPENVWVLAVAHEKLYARWMDENGVQYVRVYVR